MKRQILLNNIILLGATLVLAVSGCPIYELFGVMCPACGTTRAWLCLLSGQVEMAFKYNAFFMVMPQILLLFVNYDFLPKKYKKGSLYVLVFFGATVFLYYILRLCGLYIMPL